MDGVAEKKSALGLLGVLAGDIIGSVYEFDAPKTTDFAIFAPGSRITDDSILTVAIADAILSQRSYLDCVRAYARKYPDGGYGGFFSEWMYSDDPRPYNSFGNGSAMRVSAVAWAFSSADDVLREAEASAAISHNHPEGIKGAQAVALAIFRARNGASRNDIRDETVQRFGYDLTRSIEQIRPTYDFNETCQKTVPPAITAFLESTDYEDAIRKAISLGGDADTLAAITGSIAVAFYSEIPSAIITQAKALTPAELLDVIKQFGDRFG